MISGIAEAALIAAEGAKKSQQNLSVPEEISLEIISLSPVPDDLPCRPWLVEGALMDGQVTMLTGRGGEGKSLLALQLAIMVAAGVEFAWWEPMQKRKVLVLNAEDNIDEQHRRLLSACAVMKIDSGSLKDELFTTNTGSLVLLHRDQLDGIIKPTPLYHQLCALIRDREIGLLVIDPLIETHAYLDENSNVDMKEVILTLRRLARQNSVPVLIVHHSRKGASGGDQDGARGGSSLVNACRVVLTLDRMDESTHTKVNPPREKEFYVRVTGAKANYAGRVGDRWLEIDSVLLNNGDFSPGLKRVAFDELENGFDPLTWEHKDAFLQLIRNGRENGRPWSSATTGTKSPRLDAQIVESFGCNPVLAKKIISSFLNAGLIKKDTFLDEYRHTHKGWFIDAPEKADGNELFR